MTDQVPGIEEFEATADTVRCPKCEGPMDRGRLLSSGTKIRYEPSSSPLADSAWVDEALACISCGYTELYVDPARVRACLAGIKPPKPKKSGWF